MSAVLSVESRVLHAFDPLALIIPLGVVLLVPLPLALMVPLPLLLALLVNQVQRRSI